MLIFISDHWNKTCESVPSHFSPLQMRSLVTFLILPISKDKKWWTLFIQSEFKTIIYLLAMSPIDLHKMKKLKITLHKYYEKSCWLQLRKEGHYLISILNSNTSTSFAKIQINAYICQCVSFNRSYLE